MKKQKVQIAVALAVAFLFCPVIVMYAQTDGPAGDVVQDAGGQAKTPESGKDGQTAKEESNVAEKKAVGKTGGEEKNEGKHKETAETAKASGENTEQLRDAGGLLDLNEGDFLYRRIPDKKFPQTSSAGGDAFLQDTSANPEETPDMSQRKGLFGLSARATDYLAKGFLIFIILIIIILYRMRSRTRRSTVHKSFR